MEEWYSKRLTLFVSPEILNEYERVGRDLAIKHPGIDISKFIELIATRAVMLKVPSLGLQVCEDPDDDKFIACAIASNVPLIVSGDKHLLKISGFGGVLVLTPRQWFNKYH